MAAFNLGGVEEETDGDAATFGGSFGGGFGQLE